MANEEFDREFWEQRWAQAISEYPDAIAKRPPNSYLLTEASHLKPGRALDAGCGHGAETLWLASSGWKVTAVDFSATALEQAQSTAHTIGTDIAERVEWVQGDLTVWTPAPAAFDLVVSLYVHIPGSVDQMVARLASGVASGGMLLLVGHQPIDPTTGAPTPAAGQTQVSVEGALGALDLSEWKINTAEKRERAATGTGVDAIITAVRL